MSEPLAFVSVREIYPNIGNEAFAFKAWMEALREDDAMKIFEGTKRWAAWWLDEGTAPAYVPTLSRFLRDRRYRTDPNPHFQKGNGARGAQKVWLGSPEPSELRWTANRVNDPKITKPLSVPAYEPEKPREGFRPAAEILASRRST